MLPITPKELSGKIIYWNNDIYIKDGIKLTSEEQVIYDEYRSRLKQSLKKRFE